MQIAAIDLSSDKMKEINKHAIISNACQGIGPWVTYVLLKKGYNLVLIGENIDKLTSLKSYLSENSLPASEPRLISLPKFFDRKQQSILNPLSSFINFLDLLIINPFLSETNCHSKDSTQNNLELSYQNNFIFPIALCHQALPLLKKSSCGRIINISINIQSDNRGYITANDSAITALVRFCETIAKETKISNITVNSIIIESLNMSNNDAYFSDIIFDNPIIKLLLFLISNSSSCINGKIIDPLYDNYKQWPLEIDQISEKDFFTLRRLTAKDRGFEWGDK
jgi:short-subunit dehydrogenase